MISRKPSVSKIEGASCSSMALRSRPIPVSMFCLGSGVSDPSAWRSYSMKTRFQNSMNRSQRSQFGPQSSWPQPYSSPRS